jgi:signal transduction histidine kinase
MGADMHMDPIDHPFLAPFAPDARTKLAAAATCLRYAPGDWLFHEGDASGAALLVLDGSIEIVKETVSLDDLVRQVERLNRHGFRERRVQFQFDPTSIRLPLDSARMSRVFQNLISNAVEAMPPETGGHIALAARRATPDTVEIAIRDDGNGIPEHIRGSLFEPFVTAGKRKGLGLGMAIVKNIVVAHGGSIRFETETGKGTTFYLTLPA